MDLSVRVSFTKMHGAGNDFVILDCLRGDPVSDWEGFARFVLDRRFGVSADQLLLVQPARHPEAADLYMAIRNPDGSSAEMCANGIRAFYKYVRDRGLRRDDALRVETAGGVVTPRWIGKDQVEVEMMRPILEPAKIPTRLGRPDGGWPLLEVPLELDGTTYRVTTVSMGNPHCVIFVDDPDAFPVAEIGPRIEHHPAFPQRTNVEFAAVRSRSEILQRTWERGTGETLACGSGACATAVAAMLGGRVDRDVRIRLRGGILSVRWPKDEGPIWLAGPAAHVFDGELEVP